MKTVTINILASDFKNNNFFNFKEGIEGCPMERGLVRAGIKDPGWNNLIVNIPNQEPFDLAHKKIFEMFHSYIPIQDFSFELQIPEQYENNKSRRGNKHKYP